jgi:hypothetical protein
MPVQVNDDKEEELPVKKERNVPVQVDERHDHHDDVVIDEPPCLPEDTRDTEKANLTFKKEEDLKYDSLLFKNRRRMAWVALIAIIVLTVYVFSGHIPFDSLGKLSEITTWFYMTMGGIVLAYMGLSTCYYNKKKNT